MLTSLKIGNFKAFAEAQRIPLRPLTLIYGANSSGKSSILHSLVLARHALDTGELDVHRTNIGGESVDLGGFRQYVHRREANRRVEWAIDLDTNSFRDRLGELFATVKQVSMVLNMGIALDDRDRPLPGAKPEIHTYELVADGQSLIRMSRRKDGKLGLDRLDHEHSVFREVIKALLLLLTTTETIHNEDFEGLDEAISELVPEIVAGSTRFLPDGLTESSAYGSSALQRLFTISKATRKQDLSAALRSFLPRKIDEMLKGISKTVQEELARLRYLGPLRSYPPRHLAFSQHQDPNWNAGGGYAWDVVRTDGEVRKLVNTWLSAPNRLQTPYELVVRELISDSSIASNLPDELVKTVHDAILGFLRESPEGGGDGFPLPLVVSELFWDVDPGSKGINPDIEALASRIINAEELTKSIVDKMLESRQEQLQELVIIDKRSNTPVSHRDVGIGVSQVLPVLVGAYASKNQIIAIEQPEIHLHPALQADLGDVFINSALGENQNRFIIETHSEHLLLRIMRRMRETFNGELPEGAPPLTPKDVCVLFVEPDGSRSVVREMRINEMGEMVKAWPGGFFEEGLKEVF